MKSFSPVRHLMDKKKYSEKDMWNISKKIPILKN